MSLKKFKILQAVCLGLIHIQDIGPITFQIIEQKNVQHCETHMEAQSGKASYANTRANVFPWGQTLVK